MTVVLLGAGSAQAVTVLRGRNASGVVGAALQLRGLAHKEIEAPDGIVEVHVPVLQPRTVPGLPDTRVANVRVLNAKVEELLSSEEGWKIFKVTSTRDPGIAFHIHLLSESGAQIGSVMAIHGTRADQAELRNK
jgi:hypothetical protein